MTGKLRWVEASIYSTAGHRLLLVPKRKTLRPDGPYPTQNIMKRTVRGDEEDGGEGDLRQMLMYLAVLHARELLGWGVINIAKHTSMLTRLI